MSLVGKQVKTPSPKKSSFLYRTKARSSHVDETLFGAPTRFLQQVETKRQSHDADWDPPWSTGPTAKGTPLLWTPFEYKDGESSMQKVNTPTLPRPRSSSASRVKKIRQKSTKETPTFSRRFGYGRDNKSSSSLGGARDNSFSAEAQCPSKNYRFENASKEVKIESVSNRMQLDLGGVAAESTPIIRQRPGSNLATSQALLNAATKPMAGELEPHNESISRALRLANQSKQAYNSMMPSPIVTPLTTPRSKKSSRDVAHSPRIVRMARMSDYASPLNSNETGDDGGLLSATGTSLPLSARTPSRPSSARSVRSCRKNSSSGLKTSWKP